MNKFKSIAVATAFAASSLGATSAYAGVTLDGSFEGATAVPQDNSPFFSGLPCSSSYCYKKGTASTLPGRFQNLVFGGTGSVIATNDSATSGNSAWGFAKAPEGNTVAILQNYQGNSSSITTKVYGLIFGAVYEVVFAAQGRPGYGSNPISVSVGAGGNYSSGQLLTGTTTYVPGVEGGPPTSIKTVIPITPTTGGFNDYVAGTFKFVGGASNALTFSGLGVAGQGDVASAFDNVRLNLISAPTPEPEAYLSMILGVGLAGFVARRRAKKTAAVA